MIPPFDIELVAGPNDGERLVIDLPEPPPELNVPRRPSIADTDEQNSNPRNLGACYRLRVVAGEPYANCDGLFLYDYVGHPT